MTTRPTQTHSIEVFRPGTHVTMGGERLTFSADDLRTLAASYDRDAAPAPVVIGHPTTDAPAFGWSHGFRFDEASQRLVADVGEVVPAFAEAVRAGRYRKVSLAFFRPTEPANPKPGTWYPRHVGFLGAAAPAVTGLKTVSFAAADVVTVEFAAGTREAAGLFRRMREFLIEKFSLEDADRVLPDYEIRWLDEAGREPEPAPAPTYAAPAPEDTIMTKPAPAPSAPVDFAAREADIAAREQRLADAERQAIHGANVAFAAELAQTGRVLATQEARLVVVLDTLAGGSNAPVTFAAGEVAVTPIEALKGILRELPKVVPLGGTLPGDVPNDVPSFAAPAGLAVDRDREAVHAQAVAYQRAHPGVTYIDAVRAVDPRA